MELSQLSNEDLRNCLEIIGKQFTDTCEFNFFGAHQIDFATLKSISLYVSGKEKTFTLSLKKLINALNRKDFALLSLAKDALPKIFKSYRFLDYLLTNTTSQKGKHELQKIRAECRTPFWIQPVSAKMVPGIKEELLSLQGTEKPAKRLKPVIIETDDKLSLKAPDDWALKTSSHETLDIVSTISSKINPQVSLPGNETQDIQVEQKFEELPALNIEKPQTVLIKVQSIPDIANIPRVFRTTTIPQFEGPIKQENCSYNSYQTLIEKSLINEDDWIVNRKKITGSLKEDNTSISFQKAKYQQNSSTFIPTMHIIGGFIAILGISAVAIAFTALSGGAAFFAAGIGVAALLLGIGLFADAQCSGAHNNDSWIAYDF